MVCALETSAELIHEDICPAVDWLLLTYKSNVFKDYKKVEALYRT